MLTGKVSVEMWTIKLFKYWLQNIWKTIKIRNFGEQLQNG